MFPNHGNEILFHPSRDNGVHNNQQEKQKNQLSCLKNIAERAKERGVVPVFHPNSGENSIFRYEEDYKVMFEGLYKGGIGYAPDVGHMANGGIDPLKMIREHRDIVQHVHFKDMDASHVWATMGKGIIDFPSIVRYLEETGYRGWIMTEDESPDAVEDSDAVVLEDPGHGKSEQPRFTLSVKDQNGQEVDANCGSADFYAGRSSGNKGDGWHYESNLSWKEWTTYGIDLTRFVGQTLKITVTTYDCSQSGHYGYGYFCLGCAKAKIEGISCGDDAKMTAQAPDGFAYEWTSIHDPYTVVSTDRTLEVDAADTTTYRCRLTYLDQADCYFDLYSSIMPRFPYASLNYKYEPSNCQNRVVFTNTSHIVVKYEGDPAGTHHYDEPCEEYEWVINGEHLSDKNPIYFFPQEGGQFPVTLYASIADGKCTDDTTFTVDIPAIGDVLLNWSDSICYGSRYILGDQTLTASGVYTYTTKSHAGCDSICTLNLTVLPQALTTLPDTSICAETVYVMDGAIYPYTTSRKWIRHLQTRFGCDSTVVQSVILLDTIKPVVDVKEIIEDTDLGAFYFSGTGYSYYTINGVRHTEDSIVDLAPDTYLIVFYNDHGCEKAFTYDLAPGCVGGIVYQRWNDVLSVKAPEFAGGRSFVKYQWMKNGVDVPGATKSYYAAAQYPETEPNGHLDFSAVYEVALAVDSLATTDWQLSCPYRPIDVFSAIDYTDESVLLEPTFLHPGEDMMLLTTNKARVVCHSPAGMLIFSKDVSAGRTTLEAPVAPGMYVVTVFTGSNKKSYKICVTD